MAQAWPGLLELCLAGEPITYLRSLSSTSRLSCSQTLVAMSTLVFLPEPQDLRMSSEEMLGAGWLLPGTTESHVVTERDVLVNTAALVASLVAGQDQTVPGVGPHPHAVLHTG